ncbi:Cytochrome P450, E-class, group I [Parasponia andersonii]|uniref:Cytochrome P450, E-class, group I n=1 Tax=Parasponia andersonii TaxID=3476 RepID=A0A2P5A8K6_PARAD|nr:Cytochrome P450, E-class, group I [Parasponia andersonii]
MISLNHRGSSHSDQNSNQGSSPGEPFCSTDHLAKEFLKTHEAVFSKRPESVVVDYLSYPSVDFTFAPCGPSFKFMKKLCMPQLLGGQTLNQLLPIRSDEIKRLLKVFVKRAESKQSVDIGREVTKLTSNVVSRMVMSKRYAKNDDEADEVMKVVNESAEILGKFNLSDFIWFCKYFDFQGLRRKGKEIREKFDQMLEKIITEHQEQRKEDGYGVKDLLDILLDISEDERRLLSWHEESDIANLPYIQAIVKETLRLNPAGPLIVREASEKCTDNGYDISEKNRLIINFKPERFLSEDGSGNINQLDVRGQSFHYLPFGSGRKRVVQATVTAMIQCFEWKVDGKGGAVDMEEGPGMTLSRAHPLVCFPVARLSPIPL